MIKKVDEYIQKILAVPYSPIFGLRDDLVKKLKKDFFTECFIHTFYDFNSNILNATEPVKTAFEIDLSTKEMLDRVDVIRNDENAFMDWLENIQDTPYYVRGDAGTGKSAYLHWLKFHAEQEEPERGWRWEIIDISEANNSVKVLDVPISIPKFELIYYKVISAIIKLIERKLFIKNSTGKTLDIDKTASCFLLVFNNFREKFAAVYPDYRVRDFFIKFPLRLGNGELKQSSQICEDCGRYVARNFINLLKDYDKYEAFEVCLQIFLYILKCLDDKIKYVIAIDNVERIIGEDEIYNIEITEFASSLRTIQNAIIGNNDCLQHFYKIVVFMRNTSVRMLTPQQITDIRPSTHDMSEWFDAEAIILKKIEWYEKNDEALESANEILNILKDNINDNGRLRGLYTKISMIFNNNKRVIVHFLINIFGKESNRNYIDQYNKFYNREFDGLSNSLAQFAARSIIYRLLLNEMRQDDFFRAIMTESDMSISTIRSDDLCNQRVNQYGTVGLGYARRILTLLYDYRLTHLDNAYMSLNDILLLLFGAFNGEINNLYSDQNVQTREQIAGILFAMNYYNGRKGDWLQFIDIQYLTDSQCLNTRIPNSEKMKTILEEGVDRVKIKITNAGIAYLYFIAFSYEYFACKSIHSKTHKEVIGDYDIPPLLCTIPTKEQIINAKITDMMCIRTIKTVLIETLKCITKMNQDEQLGIPMMPFKKEIGDRPIKHTVRIVNSHRGYLDNFVECLYEIHYKSAVNDKEFGAHLELLIETIREIRDLYQFEARENVDNYKDKVERLLKDKQLKKKALKTI